MDLFITFLAGAFMAATFLLLTSLNIFFKKESSPEPPGVGGAWPIIGHLHLLTDQRPPHLTLGDMADKYGPMFQIKVGAHKVLVVSDWQIAKEIFTVKDRSFAGRPRRIASEVMGYNYAMFGFSPYGPYWRGVSKVVVVELLSNHRLNEIRHFWVAGLKSLVGDLHRSWLAENNGADESPDKSVRFVKIEIIDKIRRQTMDILTQILFGEHAEEGGKTGKTVRKFFDLLAVTTVGDLIPWLRWLDIGGHEKAMRETAKELDDMVEGWLQQHKRRREMRKKNSEELRREEEDFMDALITRIETEKDFMDSEFDSDTIIKSTCLAMLGAASDTTTVTLVWAISLLLNNPRCLEKVKAEVDNQIGTERTAAPSDLNNLPYLHAVIKETLRLYPAAPFLLPHEAIEDCTLNGCRVPKGTHLLVNLPKMHRDPGNWRDATVYRPERFLEECAHIDLKGNHFELLPFGSGRRICQGMFLALQVVGLGLAMLVQGFELKRVSDAAVDMTECSGATNMKATPLEVLVSPRLPSHLYQRS